MKNFTLITIFFTVFLDILGFGIIIPLLPFYAKNFGANEFVIGMLMASNGLAQFIFNPIWGRVSDKYGRRPVMLITVLGSGFAYYLFGVANSILVLFISRLLAGITGATVGVAQSCISDLTTREERSKVLGMLGAAFSLGFVFGPIMSGLLYDYGAHLPGYVAGVLSILNFIMVYFFLPESNTNKESKSTTKKAFDWDGFKESIKNQEMANILLIQFITMLSISNLFATSALFLNAKFHYDVKETSWIFAYFGICSSIIQGLVVGKLTAKYSEAKLLVFSAIAQAIGLGLMPFSPNLFSLLLTTGLIFCGNSVMNPCLTSLISKRAKESQIGVTLGVSQSLGSFARIFGPLWGGYIFYSAGYQYPYISGSFLSIIAFVIALKFVGLTSESKEETAY